MELKDTSLTNDEKKLIRAKLQQPCEFNVFTKDTIINNTIQKEITKDLLDIILRLELKNNILEVGCNFGYISNFLKNTFKNIKLTSIDCDKNCIKYAKKFYPNIKFKLKSFNTISHKKLLKYDTILFFRVLFTYQDFEKTLRKIKKNKKHSIRLIFYIAKVNNNKFIRQDYPRQIYQKLQKNYNINILSDYAAEIII